MTNPWNLSPGQIESVEAVIETGSVKKAADKLGLSEKTVDAQISRAKARMGVVTRVQTLLAWDRHTRPQGVQA